MAVSEPLDSGLTLKSKLVDEQRKFYGCTAVRWKVKSLIKKRKSFAIIVVINGCALNTFSFCSSYYNLMTLGQYVVSQLTYSSAYHPSFHLCYGLCCQ